MERIKKIKFAVLAIALIYACNKPPIGFLNTGDARYVNDSLIVDTVNATPDQKANLVPFTSTPMEGFEGTVPITITLFNVVSLPANQPVDITPFNESIYVRGNGIIDVDFEHIIPAGRYLLSLQVKNEGHTQEVEDIFRLIVK